MAAGHTRALTVLAVLAEPRRRHAPAHMRQMGAALSPATMACSVGESAASGMQESGIRRAGGAVRMPARHRGHHSRQHSAAPASAAMATPLRGFYGAPSSSESTPVRDAAQQIQEGASSVKMF